MPPESFSAPQKNTRDGSEIRVSSGSQAVFFGAVSGAGAYTGTGAVFFEGDLLPGNSPALVSVAGDMTLGMLSHTTMELGGLARGAQYDAFDVGGPLSLDGALDVVLYDLGGGLFSPHAGDSFDLFAAQTIFGSFSSQSFATLSNPNLFWQIDTLTDYIGTTDVVRLSIGQYATPPAPVPEPETYAMLLAGLGLLGFVGRRRRNAAAQTRFMHNAKRELRLPFCIAADCVPGVFSTPPAWRHPGSMNAARTGRRGRTAGGSQQLDG